MTKNSTSMFARSRERRRVYEGVNYSALQEDGDSDVEDTELYARPARPLEQTVERVLQPGDTLQSIALQYHVTVSELKRVNKIHRENEIYAHTSLLIPVGPISSLVDLTSPAGVHGEAAGGETRVLSIGSGCDPHEFLAAMDRDLERIRAAVPSGQSSEVLFNPGVQPGKCETTCSGSDWGLRWQQILVGSLLLTFLLPVFVWYKSHHES